MITLSHVSLTARGSCVKDVSFTVEPGECVCFVGSAGSGKTLLMELLTGERKPRKGAVTVDNVHLALLPPTLLKQYRKELGVMLQEEQLLSDRSIAANIGLGLSLRAEKDIAERVLILLERIGLTKKAALLPEHLSYGERRRVALAQIIAHAPSIILADEPLSDLDEESADIITEMLQEEHDRGATTILATHNPRSIAALSPRLLRIERGCIVRNASTSITPART